MPQTTSQSGPLGRPFKSRIRAAGHVWASAFVTFAPALFLLEYLAFGIRWGFLTGEREIDPIFGDFSLGYLIFSNAFVGAFLGLPFAIAMLILKPGRYILYVLGLGYLAFMHYAADGIAQHYQVNFGATWGPNEAFFELLYHPFKTPLIYAASVCAFLWLIRKYWRGSQ